MSEDRADTDGRRDLQPDLAQPTNTAVPSDGISVPITPQTQSAQPGTLVPDNQAVVSDPMAPSRVVRTVALALLTAVVVLGGLFLLWQVRTLIGWFVAALFLAAVLNPVVNWLQRRHRMVKRSLA